jgi:hypothetical protein
MIVMVMVNDRVPLQKPLVTKLPTFAAYFVLLLQQ